MIEETFIILLALAICVAICFVMWPDLQFWVDQTKRSDARVTKVTMELIELRRCLKELIRLYDWRIELGKLEKDPNLLIKYGKENRAAWVEAKRLMK